MRGQVVVRETGKASSSIIWTPDGRQRDVKTHRGVVLAVGPAPVENRRGVPGYGVEQPTGLRPGDVVQYHWEHNEDAFTMPWPLDGLPASWLPQRCVDMVVE
jgi:hypothetical protein